MNRDAALRAACINLAEWFYRFHPTEDQAVERLLRFAQAREAAVWRDIIAKLEEASLYYHEESTSALKHNDDEVYYESNGAKRAVNYLETEMQAKAQECEAHAKGGGGGEYMSELETRTTIMERIHDLSCTHQHIRADECAICMREFEPIIQEILKAQAPLATPEREP